MLCQIQRYRSVQKQSKISSTFWLNRDIGRQGGLIVKGTSEFSEGDVPKYHYNLFYEQG